MAILGLALAGAAATSAMGVGWSAGWIAGGLIGQAVFGGARKQTVRREGPRIEDTSVQTSTYGAPIPIVYGTVRTAGNVIWAGPLREHVTVTRETQGGGGKGGGGGGRVTTETTTYSYTRSFAVALSAGPLVAVRRIWADGKLILDQSEQAAAVSGYAEAIRIHLGDESQGPDPTLEAALGAGNVPAYRGLAYLVFTDLALGAFGNRLPLISAELVAPIGSGRRVGRAVVLPVASGEDDYWGQVICRNAPWLYALHGESRVRLARWDLLSNTLAGVVDISDTLNGGSRFYGATLDGGYMLAEGDYAPAMGALAVRGPDLAVNRTTLKVSETRRGTPLFEAFMAAHTQWNASLWAMFGVTEPEVQSNLPPIADGYCAEGKYYAHTVPFTVATDPFRLNPRPPAMAPAVVILDVSLSMAYYGKIRVVQNALTRLRHSLFNWNLVVMGAGWVLLTGSVPTTDGIRLVADPDTVVWPRQGSGFAEDISTNFDTALTLAIDQNPRRILVVSDGLCSTGSARWPEVRCPVDWLLVRGGAPITGLHPYGYTVLEAGHSSNRLSGLVARTGGVQATAPDALFGDTSGYYGETVPSWHEDPRFVK